MDERRISTPQYISAAFFVHLRVRFLFFIILLVFVQPVMQEARAHDDVRATKKILAGVAQFKPTITCGERKARLFINNRFYIHTTTPAVCKRDSRTSGGSVEYNGESITVATAHFLPMYGKQNPLFRRLRLLILFPMHIFW